MIHRATRSPSESQVESTRMPRTNSRCRYAKKREGASPMRDSIRVVSEFLPRLARALSLSLCAGATPQILQVVVPNAKQRDRQHRRNDPIDGRRQTCSSINGRDDELSPSRDVVGCGGHHLVKRICSHGARFREPAFRGLTCQFGALPKTRAHLNSPRTAYLADFGVARVINFLLAGSGLSAAGDPNSAVIRI